MTDILIASPCASLNVNAWYTKSVVELTAHLSRNGANSSYTFLRSADLVLNRNILASQALSQSRFSHILFVDDDISFPPETVSRMLEAKREFVAAIYPLRHIDFSVADKRAAQLVSSGDQINMNEVIAESTHWCFSTTETQFKIGDVITVAKIGFGLVLLDVGLLKKLIAKGKAPEYPRTGAITQTTHPVYDFFSPPQLDDGSYIFEDIAFCKRVQEIGTDLHALVTEDVEHWGDFGYKARLPRG